MKNEHCKSDFIFVSFDMHAISLEVISVRARTRLSCGAFQIVHTFDEV